MWMAAHKQETCNLAAVAAAASAAVSNCVLGGRWVALWLVRWNRLQLFTCLQFHIVTFVRCIYTESLVVAF
jgi:hypothetical protein